MLATNAANGTGSNNAPCMTAIAADDRSICATIRTSVRTRVEAPMLAVVPMARSRRTDADPTARSVALAATGCSGRPCAPSWPSTTGSLAAGLISGVLYAVCQRTH